MSAPSASGCWRYGVANVLSTTTFAPRSWASRATAAMSTIVSRGLVGVSTHTSLVDGRNAATVAAWSVRSTAVCVMPIGPCTRSINRNVPPYGVVAHDDVIARPQAAQDRIFGSQAGPERRAEGRTFERRQAAFERRTRRVARARVFEASMLAHLFLRERGRRMDRRDHGPGRLVRGLPRVDRTRFESELRGVDEVIVGVHRLLLVLRSSLVIMRDRSTAVVHHCARRRCQHIARTLRRFADAEPGKSRVHHRCHRRVALRRIALDQFRERSAID